MADDADRATPNIENMIADGMARARRHLERSLPITGLCHWCGDEAPGRIFCSKDCADDWDAEREARKRNGTA